MKLVYFVDDDILALNRLRGMIDWNARGYEICGQAMDGVTALSQVEQLMPDLVVLDIDMPRMNGVEVAGILHQRLPGLQILILSNHDNFEYVRPVMKHGVHDYILKHQFSPTVLLQKLEELDALSDRESLIRSRDHYFASVAKQQYLRSLITQGAVTDEERRLMLTQPEFSGGSAVLSVMQIVNFILLTHFDRENGKQRLIDSVQTLSDNIFSSINNGLMTHIEHGRFVVLFTFTNRVSEHAILESTGGHMAVLAGKIRKFLNVQVLHQESAVIRDRSRLEQEYRSALQKLERQPLAGETAAVPSPPQLDLLDEKDLSDALAALDVSRCCAILDRIWKPYAPGGSPPGDCQLVVRQLLQIGERLLSSHRLTLDQDYTAELQSRFRTLGDAATCLDVIRDYYQTLIDQVLRSSLQRYPPAIRKAVSYIHANYSLDISLADVADHAGVSAAHLSRQFRKETGSGFSEYLADYRISLARELLKTPGVRIKDVSRQVGFQNYNYFLRVFKEKTGVTTSHFT